MLVAPLRLFKWRSTAWRPHDSVTFWLVRWLLFRLMFASGVVKLTSRCPTWWGLTGEGQHGLWGTSVWPPASGCALKQLWGSLQLSLVNPPNSPTLCCPPSSHLSL